MSCWPRWSSCSRGPLPWPAALIAPSPQVLPTSHAVTHRSLVVVAQLTLGTFSRMFCRPIGSAPTWVISIGALLLSEQLDWISTFQRMVTKSFLFGVFCWLRPWSPGAPHARISRHGGIAMSLPGKCQSLKRPSIRAAITSRCGRAHRGRPPSASLPLSGSDQPLQSAVHDFVLVPTRSLSRRQT